MKSKRIILDTNLWIYFLISDNLNQLDKHIINGSVKLIFSQELLEEFLEVSSRPKFQRYFTFPDITNLLRLFDFYGELVTVTTKLDVCRDPKDNFLLELAVDGKADFLVTGDQDLLVLNKFENAKIVTMQAFLHIVKKEM